MNTVIKGDTVAKMKYVVQCFISDKTGRVLMISGYTAEQLEYAYQKACEWYAETCKGGPLVLPCPDNGRYQDYVA